MNGMGPPPAFRGGGGPGRRRPLTEEEKAQCPALSAALLRRIFSYLRPYRLRLVLVLLVVLVSAAVGLLPSLLTARMIDEGLIAQNWAVLWQLVLLSLGVVLLSQGIGVFQSYLNTYIAQHITFDMKNEMYDHLLHMSHRFFTDRPQGELITRMTGDISGVQAVISNTLTGAFANLSVLVVSLVAMYRIHWVLATVGVVLLPCFVIPARLAGRYRWRIAARTQEKWDEQNQLLNETMSVSGQLLVKLFCREDSERERFCRVNEETRQLSIRETVGSGWFHAAISLFMNIGPLLIYLAGGFLLLRAPIGPALTVGSITAMVSLLNRMFRPLDQLLNLGVDLTRSLALFSRIFGYLDLEPEITDREGALSPDEIAGELGFSHVSFWYHPERPILRDVSFIVRPGQTFAVVGTSGEGKTTLISLIPRLFDVCGGAVTVDGHDVRDLTLVSLRRHVGMVTQDTYLFNDTIRQNLLYACPSATEEQLTEACRRAHILDFIEALPQGFDTVVGNRGLKLSGGEKQRLSLARVILKDPPILLLDEATSSLDSISESHIQEAIRPLLAHRTALVVAHRLSTVLSADEILVLEHGVITARGPHSELLDKSPHYRELYQTQFLRPLERAGGAQTPLPPIHPAAFGGTPERKLPDGSSL